MTTETTNPRLQTLRDTMRRGQQAAADLAESESRAKEAAGRLASAQQEAEREIHRHNFRGDELRPAIDAGTFAKIEMLRALPPETRKRIADAQSRLDRLASEIRAAEQHLNEKQSAMANAPDATAKSTYAGHLRRATTALAELKEQLPAAVSRVDQIVSESVDGTAELRAAL